MTIYAARVLISASRFTGRQSSFSNIRLLFGNENVGGWPSPLTFSLLRVFFSSAASEAPPGAQAAQDTYQKSGLDGQICAFWFRPGGLLEHLSDGIPAQ